MNNINDDRSDGSVLAVAHDGEATGFENPLHPSSIAEEDSLPSPRSAAGAIANTAEAAGPVATAENDGTSLLPDPGNAALGAAGIVATPTESPDTPADFHGTSFPPPEKAAGEGGGEALPVATNERAPADEDGTTAAPSAEPDGSSGGILEPATMDVLCGRGAFVNAHLGNKKFRALCFSRKPEFDVGNHAAKRRISSEIVRVAMNDWGSRFLKRSKDKGPWTEMTAEQAVLKASQVMRDYKRPDRLALREASSSGKKKKYRDSATPMEDVVVPEGPLDPIVENPFGVHDHDVLCGRGAFVNGHVGNQRLRDLALERKVQFDRGNYTEKRGLATEVVTIIRSLHPPGRFLQRASATTTSNPSPDGQSTTTNGIQQDGVTWEELSDEKAIHKACQVMRDIDRPDRKHREERKKLRKLAKEQKLAGLLVMKETQRAAAVAAPPGTSGSVSLPGGGEVETTSSELVEAAVAAAANAVEMALESTQELCPGRSSGAPLDHDGQQDEVKALVPHSDEEGAPNAIISTIAL